MKSAHYALVAPGLFFLCGISHAGESENIRLAFDIHAKQMEEALTEFAQATQLQVLFQSDIATKQLAPTVSGSLTPEAALQHLLADSGLSYEFINPHTVTIRTAAVAAVDSAVSEKMASPSEAHAVVDPSSSLGSVEPAPTERIETAAKSGASARGVPEILVQGSKVLNMDVKRSQDDAQPYIIFDKETIAQSGANTVDEFLKQRLTANSQGESNLQRATGAGGNASQINLRGLGQNQTLILVDGHRMAGMVQSADPLQPDLNGIPLLAIERIEVLPTTASAIYGGSATGGVVNIVMRRDYAGVESQMTYGGAFDGGFSSRRANISSGFSLEEGKTNVLFTGTWNEDSGLLARERDFLVRARESIIETNGGSFDALSSGSARPPLGAQTNIRSTTGANLTLKGTNQPLGSPITFLPTGFDGVATSGTAGLLQNAGRYNIDLPQTPQSAGGGLYPLLAEPTVKSGALSVRRRFSPRWEAFLDTSMSSNTSAATVATVLTGSFTVDASARNNPFNQAINVALPIGESYWRSVKTTNQRAVGGVVAKLSSDWMAELDHTWNRARYEYEATPPTLATTAATAAIRNGSLNVLRDLGAFPVDLSAYLLPIPQSSIPETGYLLGDTVLRAAGPIGLFPGHALTLTALLERRTENLDSYTFATVVGAAPSVVVVPGRKQSVNSAYLETQIPIVSASDGRSGVRAFDLQLAVRHDEYTTTGSAANSTASAENKVDSTDPLVGIRYQPLTDVTLRASYGTGFLPPGVSQLVPSPPRSFTPPASTVDPKRNNASVGTIQQTLGGNADLKPEDSKSWSAGLVFSPRFVPGARLSVDYTRIDKKNNIGTFSSIQEAINNEDLFPGVVIRDAPEAGQTAGQIKGLNFTSFNLARAQVEAYDAQLDYRLETGFGSFSGFALATWQTHFKTKLSPDSPIVENVGFTYNSPVKVKANFGLSWNSGPWGLGWSARYFDSYLVINPAIASTQNDRALRIQGNGGRVPSQRYHDVFATYQVVGPRGGGFGFLDDAEIRLGVQNLFNTKPPVDTSYDYGYSPLGDPRLASYYLTLKVGF